MMELNEKATRFEGAEIENARRLEQALAPLVSAGGPLAITVRGEGGESSEAPLEPALARAFLDLLRHAAQGREVALTPKGGRLSTQQAADLLNVSRPYLIGLIDRGELSCVKVGRHRRLSVDEVLTYKRRRDVTRADALSKIAEFDADEGLI